MSLTDSKKPLKLMLFRPTLGQGGADRVTLTLLKSFDPQRFDVSLALMRLEGSLVGSLPPNVKVHALDAASLKTAWLPLLRLLRSESPDILFSTSSGANVAAVVSHSLARRKSRLILSERNVLLHGRINAKKKFILLLKRLLYGRADHITSVSQGVKDDLMRRLQIPDERITVVYNPVLTDDLQRQASEPVEHPWFSEDVPIILGVGRLVEEKDFPTLIKAFAAVRAKQSARLFILGEGALLEDLKNYAASLGVGEDVCFGGFDVNPFKYMAQCACFVLSSKFEGLPGALIQAMACGAAVVSTDCPSGPSEIITPDADGFLVPVGDAGAMAEKIERLLEHPETREKFSRAAKNSVQRFKVDKVIEYYTDALFKEKTARNL